MSTEEATLQDMFSLGPITVAEDRIDPARLVELGAKIMAQVAAKATFANLPGIAASVLDALGQSLRIRLSEICVDAWNKREELQKLDKPSDGTSAKPRVVTLAPHTVSWDYSPTVRLSANDVTLAELPFKAAIEFSMNGVVLTIVTGRLMRVETGTGTMHGTLHCGELELVHRESAPHRLPGSLAFHDGIPLGASRPPLTPAARGAH